MHKKLLFTMLVMFLCIRASAQKPPLDHYLKDAPMPYWMKYGIKQTEKGKIDGYNLIQN